MPACRPYSEAFVQGSGFDVPALLDDIANNGRRPLLNTNSESVPRSLDILIQRCLSNDLDDRLEFHHITQELISVTRSETYFQQLALATNGGEVRTEEANAQTEELQANAQAEEVEANAQAEEVEANAQTEEVDTNAQLEA